jgi:hypothetical protein
VTGANIYLMISSMSIPAESGFWAIRKLNHGEPGGPEVLLLYPKREQVHEHGVSARFRYSDLKEADRGCGGRGRYANSKVGRGGVEVRLGCAAARHT